MAEHLLRDCHGSVLRLLSSHCGRHFEGLAQGARQAGLRGQVGRHLRELDVVCAWLRHVTQPRVDSLVMTVQEELLKLNGMGREVDRKLSSPSSSEAGEVKRYGVVTDDHATQTEVQAGSFEVAAHESEKESV